MRACVFLSSWLAYRLVDPKNLETLIRTLQFGDPVDLNSYIPLCYNM